MSAAAKAPSHTPSKTLAALFGAPATAYAAGAALVAWLPTEPDVAFAIGTHAMIPLWVALSCTLPLVRSGARAWLLCAAVVVPVTVALGIRASS